MGDFTENTPIDKLPPGLFFELCQLLDAYKKWPDLVGVFRDRQGNLLYTADTIAILRLEYEYKRSPTEAFFNMLSFENTTARMLRKALLQANLPRFANMLIPSNMNASASSNGVLASTSPPPSSPPPSSPSSPPEPAEQPIPHHLTSQAKLSGDPKECCNEEEKEEVTLKQNGPSKNKKQTCDEDNRNDTALFVLQVSIAHRTGAPCSFTYDELSRCTENFNRRALIGEGGFGQVFKGRSDIGAVAIKRLMKLEASMHLQQQFTVEVEILARFRHPNVLPLYGFCATGTYKCIVSAYMQNGSLEDRLACLNGSPPLSVKQRLSIARDTVHGLVHLHTFEGTPVVHRDIKSANILLDGQFVAKLADCALARVTDPQLTSVQTVHVIGTSIYMAPEYKQNGNISVKLDSFSFGVVLLELLTGLPIYDVDREDPDLPTHISENMTSKGIIGMVDRMASDWNEHVVDSMYNMSMRCRDIKRRRPTIEQILPDVENWQR